MGGGGHQMPEVPNFTKYKWQDIPQMVKHQERLAERGLHDPWARNHVWKFIKPLTNNRQLPWYRIVFVNWPPQRGFLLGLGALGIYIGLDKMVGGSDSGHH